MYRYNRNRNEAPVSVSDRIHLVELLLFHLDVFRLELHRLVQVRLPAIDDST